MTPSSTSSYKNKVFTIKPPREGFVLGFGQHLLCMRAEMLWPQGQSESLLKMPAWPCPAGTDGRLSEGQVPFFPPFLCLSSKSDGHI